MMFLFKSLIVLIFVALNIRLVFASTGAISRAQGGAGRSAVDAGEGYLLNPAAISHLRGATISLGTVVTKEHRENNSNSSTSGWQVNLNENGPDSIIGTSLAFSKVQRIWSPQGNHENSETSDVWLGMGNFLYPQISLGLTYHYRQTAHSKEISTEHNFGLGLLWTPFDFLGVGASFQDIKPTSQNLPPELDSGSTSGIGLLYLHDTYLRLRADYSRKFHNLASESYSEWSIGLENLITPWVISRLGFAIQKRGDLTEQQKIALGLGFAGPRFGIHYSYQQYRLVIKGMEHSVDFIIPF